MKKLSIKLNRILL